MTTPVLFRKTVDNKVLAIFPTVPGPKGSIDSVCAGYGENGNILVDTAMLKHTKPASFGEYADLMARMAHAGHTDVKIVLRVTSEHIERRSKAKRGEKFEKPQARPLIMQVA